MLETQVTPIRSSHPTLESVPSSPQSVPSQEKPALSPSSTSNDGDLVDPDAAPLASSKDFAQIANTNQRKAIQESINPKPCCLALNKQAEKFSDASRGTPQARSQELAHPESKAQENTIVKEAHESAISEEYAIR